jgi:alpha-mannosidase
MSRSDGAKSGFGLLALALLLVACTGVASAQSKRVFMAPDDHTDYFWTATDVQYRQMFLTMLDYYINQADATAGERPEYQSRFSADGSLWLWEYEKNKTGSEFQRLVDKLKSGHISAPKNPLVITYGGVPAEAVLRSMYYSGQLERRYGLEFPLAIAMENAGMAYGLGALWAGAGARYSWKGVCNCFTLISGLDDRDHEIYRWVGPDGSSLIMKWFSLLHPNDNQSIGGYAEARVPATALNLVTSQAGANGFAARYPYDTIGVFGQGWDDPQTTNLNVQQACKADTDPSRQCIVSNTVDFFQEFEPRYGATLPELSASFGNEWDLAPASLAEVSARVKRAVERLRTAETLATLVSLVDPTFMDGRSAARDRAFLDMGLYFEHDFENGGPGVSGATRIAWQRQVATEIEAYVDALVADGIDALGALITKSGANPRVFVLNPLSWTRSDVADIAYAGPLPAHVVDVASGAELPSQVVTVDGVQYLRVAVSGVPSVGYSVLEIRAGAGQAFGGGPTADAASGVMENELYRVTVAPRGAITSLVDKRLGNREMVGSTGGFALNDLGPAGGTLQIENAGPVSVTLLATSPAPLAHRTRVTLLRGSDRIEIKNEVTQNFGDVRSWRFSLNLTSPDVRHEEVGAIARARLTTAGGSYAPRNARYDYLTLNHFADMTGAGPVGVTLSNADAYFMQVGSSGVSTLDTTTPQLSVLLGGGLRPSNPIPNQGGDASFLQRFALRSHGAYDQAAAMRFALEHQNPLTVGPVSGGGSYPEASHSFLSISDPGVLLWALKPAEEGIAEGVIARVWNLSAAPTTFSLGLDEPIASARYVWHTETDRAAAPVSAGVATPGIAQNQLLSLRLFPGSLPQGVKIVASQARAVEGGQAGAFTISRSQVTSSALDVRYTVGGTATPGSDYQALSGVATIPANASSVTVSVLPIADTTAEPNETVVVTLTPQPQYLLGDWNSATVWLVNAGSPPPSGAVGFAFNEGSGTSTADTSGTYTGTLQNGTLWTAGRYGTGLGLDGTNDFVSIADAPPFDLGRTGTIEAWVKLTTLGRWHGVISKGTPDSDPAHNYALEIDNTNRVLCILGSGASALQLRGSAVSAGQLYHLACAWDGTRVNLYVNGTLQASVAQTLTPAANAAPLFIGQFGASADRLQGMIDEVRIYTRALTQAQIQDDMNTPLAAGGGAPPPDATAPTVSLTAPAAGATVSGTVSVTATASDNVGVAGVRFTLDGADLAAEDAVAPYAVSWDTTTAANGTHVLRAVARDAAGNVGTSASVSITVSNTAPDTSPPSTPSDLTATATASSQIRLAWTASTDDVGVTGYRVRRNGAAIATVAASSYTDSGLAPDTAYTYTVAALDAAGNSSPESAPASARTAAAAASLVAAYSFQAGSGTIAQDLSGSGNHATLTNGPTWTAAGTYGNAISFDGVDDYLVAPASPTLDLRQSGTLEAWIKVNTLARWHGVISKGTPDSDPAHNYALEIDNTNRVLCILGNGASALQLRGSAIAAGQLYHLACAWDGARVNLYVNGALQASSAQTLTPAANAAPLYIGQFGASADRLQGMIDEVRIYNRALTQPEVQADMNTPL